MNDRLTTIFAAIQYWVNYNYGPLRLFDDVFFETKNGKAIREIAVREMVGKPNIDYWNSIVERARKVLQDMPSELVLTHLNKNTYDVRLKPDKFN